MCTDARRSTLLWIKSQLLVEAVAHRAVAAAVEAVVALVAAVQLLLFLAQRLLPRPVTLLLVAVVAGRPVAAVVAVDRAAVEVEAAVVDRLLLVIARGPQFPAWKSSTPCLRPASIPMRRLAHVGRKPVPAVVSAILC